MSSICLKTLLIKLQSTRSDSAINSMDQSSFDKVITQEFLEMKFLLDHHFSRDLEFESQV
jgi:hypothetical protein